MKIPRTRPSPTGRVGRDRFQASSRALSVTNADLGAVQLSALVGDELEERVADAEHWGRYPSPYLRRDVAEAVTGRCDDLADSGGSGPP